MLFLNAALVVVDIVYCYIMSGVWGGKPVHHEKVWKAFDNIRTITLWLSYINIAIRVVAILLLSMIMKPDKDAKKF